MRAAKIRHYWWFCSAFVVSHEVFLNSRATQNHSPVSGLQNDAKEQELTLTVWEQIPGKYGVSVQCGRLTSTCVYYRPLMLRPLMLRPCNNVRCFATGELFD